MIQLEHVTKVYGTRPAVRDLSLDIPAGELFALRGELTTVEEREPAAAAGQYL